MAFIPVPSVVVTILAYSHIVSAVGWFGGALLFVTAVSPPLRRLGPAASLEFLVKVVPRVTNYFILLATSTIIFGPLLLLTIPDFQWTIYLGIATAVTAYIGVMITVHYFHRAISLAKEMMKGGQAGPPPVEFQKSLRNGGIGALSVLILLVITEMFMVYSGYPF